MKTIDDICGRGSFKRFIRMKNSFLRGREAERKFRIARARKGILRAIFSRVGMKAIGFKLKHIFTPRLHGVFLFHFLSLPAAGSWRIAFCTVD